MPVIASRNDTLFKNNMQYTIKSIQEDGQIGLFNSAGKLLTEASTIVLKQAKVNRQAAVNGCLKALRMAYCEAHGRHNVPRLVTIGLKARAEAMVINTQGSVPVYVGTVVHLSIGEKTLVIPLTDLKAYFAPAYCVTSHKVQGATIVGPYTIHEWYKLNKYGRYVALTRAQKGKDVTICYN